MFGCCLCEECFPPPWPGCFSLLAINTRRKKKTALKAFGSSSLNMGVRWFGCDSFPLLVFTSVQIPLSSFWVCLCIHSMAASERISQMSSTWVPLLLLQRQSLLLCGYLSCMFSCLRPEIQMVLPSCFPNTLGKLSETGNVFPFTMSSTKSVCNSVFAILISVSPFSSTFEFFCYESAVNRIWLIIVRKNFGAWSGDCPYVAQYTGVLI